MFGLQTDEPYVGYLGWRAIYTDGYIDILPDRGSKDGSTKAIAHLLAWVNHPPSDDVMSPWRRMMEEVPKELTPFSTRTWEIREGDFVLAANANASGGYMYIALYQRAETNGNQ